MPLNVTSALNNLVYPNQSLLPLLCTHIWKCPGPKYTSHIFFWISLNIHKIIRRIIFVFMFMLLHHPYLIVLCFPLTCISVPSINAFQQVVWALSHTETHVSSYFGWCHLLPSIQPATFAYTDAGLCLSDGPHSNSTTLTSVMDFTQYDYLIMVIIHMSTQAFTHFFFFSGWF